MAIDHGEHPMPQWKRGDRVNWSREQRGGYGFVTQVAGIVEKATATRVTIMVALRIDGQWVRVKRSVMPGKLTARVGAVAALGEQD
ncbi:hypothetical protein [Ralstonia sp. OTU4908]|uniref:hypothetical protein n=1 Tax=Ralstonia sp. OTU4908 TaxID=3043851 RepID=UPI00313DF0D5